MRINKGVEWAAHACSLLGPLWPEKGLPLSALAEFHELPEAYMAKQMQALSKAGIVTGGRGRNGFYTLARAPKDITLLDILLAVDGEQPMFSCTEIRQNGPCAAAKEDCTLPCGIAKQFAEAEKLYRGSLAAVDLASLQAQAVESLSPSSLQKTADWLLQNHRPKTA
ncbi:MAG: Rrf2 family transcriptional regulator [Alphaproteobacteria bacterium]|nr:Rrf2 family transcriptional regulator [Alphaproteobacteria bacterium]